MTPMPMPIAPETAALINKGLGILAIAVFLAAAATIFPSFQPNTTANAAPVKADKLSVPNAAPVKAVKLSVPNANPACAEQNWPNFDTSCLKRADTNSTVKQVRTVSTDKL